jgi:hypothetical protein
MPQQQQPDPNTGLAGRFPRVNAAAESLLDLFLGAIGVGPETPANQAGQLVSAGLPLAGAPKAIKAAATAAKAERQGLAGIKAYHGSPHDFDQFSLAHIGKGEGAQAYGHGLYFADSEGVARSYKNAGVRVKLRTDEILNAHGGDRDKAIAAVQEAIAGNHNGGAAVWGPVLDDLNAMPKGRMYEVNINAGPDQMLDWDAPLAAQPPQVQQALAKYGVKAPERELLQEAEDQLKDYWTEYSSALSKGDKGRADIFERSIRQAEFDLETLRKSERMTGAAAYREVAPKSDAVASQRLREAGVPGIRYFDGSSRNVQLLSPKETTHGQWLVKQIPNGNVLYRGADEAAARAAYENRSRNYVMFDDSLIEIARKYGLLAPLAAGSLASQYQPKK